MTIHDVEHPTPFITFGDGMASVGYADDGLGTQFVHLSLSNVDPNPPNAVVVGWTMEEAREFVGWLQDAIDTHPTLPATHNP